MKKSLVALAVLAASGAAMAQSSVTISGNVAAAYERLDTGKAQLSTYDTGTNRIVFAGTEDLGGGLKAGFHLQQRLDVMTGTNQNGATGDYPANNPGTLAFEETFVSLSGGFGTVKAGRFQAFSNARFDAFGGLGVRVYQTFGYNSFTHNRNNKQISYDSPTISGFTVGVATTVNPSVNTGSEYTVVRAMYAKGPLDVQASIEYNAVIATRPERTDYAIGASYDFGVAKAYLLTGKEEGTKAATSVGVTAPFGAALLKAQYRSERVNTHLTTGAVTTLGSTFAVGVDYSLSKRTVLFADASNVKDAAQQAFRLGVRHSF